MKNLVRWLAVILPLALSTCAVSVPAAAQLFDQNQRPLFVPGTVLTGSMTTAGTSSAVKLRGNFNLTIWGTFSGTCEVDKSFDATTWFPLSALGTQFTWSTPTAETLSEPEYGVSYRFNCTSLTSGTVNYRFSQ